MDNLIHMKHIILLIGILLAGCSKPNQRLSDIEAEPTDVKKRHIMDEVSHGLNMITIDDTTTILIYRGVESCTMIQLK